MMMKHLNKNMIREILLEKKEATKPQLAKYTGLSVVTINSLMRELVASQEVYETKEAISSGGRPALIYRYNEMYKLAMTIGMLVHDNKELVFIEVHDLNKTTIASTAVYMEELTAEKLKRCMHTFIDKYPAISLITIGIPGVEKNGKFMVMDYELYQVDGFFQNLEELFQLPVIYENDINAALIGYCHNEQVAYEDCVAGLYIPGKYPPGSGIYMKHDIYKGFHGLAGEISYMPLGIEWEQASYDNDEGKIIVEKLILSISCMYDPRLLLLYCDITDMDTMQSWIDEIKMNKYRIVLPEIKLMQDMQKDFAQGIREIAQQGLMKQILKERKRKEHE